MESEKLNFKKQLRKLLVNIYLIVIGFTLALSSDLMGSIEMATLTFTAGLFIAFSGITFTALQLHKQEKSLIKDKTGIIWVWAVCAIGIVAFSITYVVLMWPFYLVIDMVTATYTFPAEAQAVISLLLKVAWWMPIMVVSGFILWAYVNSGRREEPTYGYYS